MGRSKWVCTVPGCAANPSKRNNIERHVWLQHIRRLQSSGTQDDYKVSQHKQLVEAYIRRYNDKGLYTPPATPQSRADSLDPPTRINKNSSCSSTFSSEDQNLFGSWMDLRPPRSSSLPGSEFSSEECSHSNDLRQEFVYHLHNTRSSFWQDHDQIGISFQGRKGYLTDSFQSPLGLCDKQQTSLQSYPNGERTGRGCSALNLLSSPGQMSPASNSTATSQLASGGWPVLQCTGRQDSLDASPLWLMHSRATGDGTTACSQELESTVQSPLYSTFPECSSRRAYSGVGDALLSPMVLSSSSFEDRAYNPYQRKGNLSGLRRITSAKSVTAAMDAMDYECVWRPW